MPIYQCCINRYNLFRKKERKNIFSSLRFRIFKRKILYCLFSSFRKYVISKVLINLILPYINWYYSVQMDKSSSISVHENFITHFVSKMQMILHCQPTWWQRVHLNFGNTSNIKIQIPTFSFIQEKFYIKNSDTNL